MKRVTKKMKLAEAHKIESEKRLNITLRYILGLHKVGNNERHIEVESQIIFSTDRFSFLGV